MQQKIIIDTNVYIDIFNKGLYADIINPFQNITYLAYPVLHELWMGLKNRHEVRLLTAWRDRFITLQRFVVPTTTTLVLIGDVCLKLKMAGMLDPTHPKHYNDISIAALARQIGAVLITQNTRDFEAVGTVIDIRIENV